MNPNQPRLLPDFAAVPTRTERAGTRRYWQTAQEALDLFADAAPVYCACCGSSSHETTACTIGEALALDLLTEQTAAVRYEYATAAECGADGSRSAGAVLRSIALQGHTRCPDCPGDLTDSHHWTEVDLAGKPVPFPALDMFDQARLAAMGPRKEWTR